MVQSVSIHLQAPLADVTSVGSGIQQHSLLAFHSFKAQIDIRRELYFSQGCEDKEDD